MSFSEAIEFILVFLGCGSLIALGISRIKYGADWLDAWLLVVKALSILTVIVVGAGEYSSIYPWLSNKPVLVSCILALSALFGVVIWTIRIRARKRLPRDSSS